MRFVPYKNNLSNLIAENKIEPFAVGMLTALADRIQKDINQLILDTTIDKVIRDNYRALTISENIIDDSIVEYFSIVTQNIKQVWYNKPFSKQDGFDFFYNLIRADWSEDIDSSQEFIYEEYNKTFAKSTPLLKLIDEKDKTLYKIIF